MTAASNSEGRKRATVAVDPVEVVARALFEHQTANLRPRPTYGNPGDPWASDARSEARAAIAALRAEGFAL